MTSETKRANEKAAHVLGQAAYEREDNDSDPYSDSAFLRLIEESPTYEETMARAYNRGFDDAMYAAIQE